MSHEPRSASRGFTLIELMIVVAIIGLITSIAIPTFQVMQFRARSAERATIMRSLLRAAQDYVIRTEGGTATLDLAPPAPVTGAKKAFKPAPASLPAWEKVGFSVEGTVYYHYAANIFLNAGQPTIYLESRGDLDSNGVISQHWELWALDNGMWNRVDHFYSTEW